MKKTFTVMLAVGLLTGCTIDRRTVVTETTTTTKAPTPTTTEATTYDPEYLYVDSIRSIHNGPVYATDQDLLDTGYAVCNGAANGATAQDMIDGINASASDQDSYDLLMELTVAALMFLCPQYQYLIDDPSV
jgi:hypothetical protein